MERRLFAARAGFGVACGLFLAAFLPTRSARVECPDPGLSTPGEVFCAAGGAPLAGPERRLFGLRVDPNRADSLTLETLPGIGAARARAIIAERERRPFRSVADLQRVYGLGPARVAALAEFVGFDAELAGEDAASVKSGTCRSSCGDAATGEAVSSDAAGAEFPVTGEGP